MFRFTIRDVLWLTVCVALSLSWAMDHRWLAKENRQQFAAGMDAAEQWLAARDEPGAARLLTYWYLTRYGIPTRPVDGKFHPGFAN
jgi:hypothetical protein